MHRPELTELRDLFNPSPTDRHPGTAPPLRVWGDQIEPGDYIETSVGDWTRIERIDPYTGPHLFCHGIARFADSIYDMTITDTTLARRKR